MLLHRSATTTNTNNNNEVKTTVGNFGTGLKISTTYHYASAVYKASQPRLVSFPQEQSWAFNLRSTDLKYGIAIGILGRLAANFNETLPGPMLMQMVKV
ncbi:hypothetical protein EVAR_68850_1 [Eumeta japonica]|uniref:Uncharacterized protein n=1 Tax=Eumeta variegata TaxID=151549 RepID=A0A4C2A8X0_EUMVA|nr:hypothetical protein EVAR_68850_1 [Eumeta japonica]